METDGLICYRMPTVGSDCVLTGLNTAAGSTIGSSSGLLVPTIEQCNLILHNQWPVLTYWFAELFPTIVQNLNMPFFPFPILWIIEFGPNKLRADPKWKSFLTDINALGVGDWKNFLAWGGTTPQYTPDGGTTIKDLPDDLGARMRDTPESMLLNSHTEVCTPGTALQSQCVLAGVFR